MIFWTPYYILSADTGLKQGSPDIYVPLCTYDVLDIFEHSHDFVIFGFTTASNRPWELHD